MTRKVIFVINSQQEFWRREFGGQIVEKGNDFVDKIHQILKEGHRPVIQLDADFAELEALSSFPRNSLIGWCHADERFDLAFNSKLATIDSLSLILRPYRLNSFKPSNLWSSIRYSFANSKEVRSFREILQLIAWQIRGFAMQFRQWYTIGVYKRNGRKHANIPIGYTNIFAKSFLSYLGIGDDSQDLSLFEVTMERPDSVSPTVTFVGQEGQVVRKLAVRALGKDHADRVISRSSYGASNVLDASVIDAGAEYVSTLATSWFVLCPPGNISGETFRFYEAVVMNRVPLTLEHVTCDPNFHVNHSFPAGWETCRSWRTLIQAARTLDNDAYEVTLRQLRANAKDEISVLQRILESP